VHRMIKRITGLVLALILTGTGVAHAEPGYYPTGPQENVSLETVKSGGWDVCYLEDLGTPLTDEILLAHCNAKYVMYSGGEDTDPDNLLLLAAGESSAVYTETSANGTTESNGTFWYFNGSSFGFASTDLINQNTADTCDALIVCDGTDNGRLSFHNSDEIGGWRIGDINGSTQGGNNAVNNGPNAWFKIILISNGGSTSAVSPLEMIKEPTISSKDGNISCTPGVYKMGSSQTLVDSVSYQLFINGVSTGSVVFDPMKQFSSSTTNASKYAAIANNEKVTWDTKGLSNYSASCEISVLHHGAIVNSKSSSLDDSVLADAKAKALEAARLADLNSRAAATAANFTKDMREMRKRLAARQP
jgi:hypothetical protein